MFFSHILKQNLFSYWDICETLSLTEAFFYCVFIYSVKFMNKIQYVHSLDELAAIVPMEHVHVPECVVQ